MQMNKKEKIAVFDLDDTLYKGNSHFLCIDKFWQINLFTSIPFRGLGKLFPKLHLWLADYFYRQIPYEYKCKFTLPYREDVLELFFTKKQAGYHMLIISNAPIELLRTAAKKLDTEYIKAGIGEKAACLQKYATYQKLFVCTDNKTDLDLLNIADEAIITCRPAKRAFFIERLKCKNYKFIEDVFDNEM